MVDKIQIIKKTLSSSQDELNSIIESYQSLGADSTKHRLLRWKERTKQRLIPYLTEPEVKNFEMVVQRISDTIGPGYYSVVAIEYKGYCLELNDDLNTFPQNIVLNMSETIPSDGNVFISYAWANDDIVLAIDQWLRNKGIKTRIDKRDFFAGSRIRDEILRVMNDCKVILVCHSQQSKDKPWIQFERELAADLEMSSKEDGKEPPRIIYMVFDETPLPSISEKNRIAIMAKGKRFDIVCDELYQNILQLPRTTPDIDLSKWSNFTF